MCAQYDIIEHLLKNMGDLELILFIAGHLTTPTLSSNDNRPVNGSEVNLHCDDHNQNVTSYTFYRNQQDACSQKHVNCTGSYLIFQPIMEGDAGSYTCTIQNPISSNSSNAVDLSVSVRVSQVKIQSNTSSMLWVGRDSVSLQCSALGTDVQFSWNLNGEKLPSNPRYSLQQNDSVLIIHPVDRSDIGSFTCTASNWLNTMTSDSLKLNLGLPVSEVKIQSNTSSSVILWAGIDSVSLSCSADGSALHFSWNLNGVPLPSDSRYQYNQDNSTIIISPLDKKDSGTFTCTATNILNSDTSSDLNLNLAWHPDGDIQCSANGAGETVNLFCSWPGGFPQANINLTFQSQNLTGRDQVMHNVPINTITSNDELFCHGAQGGREMTCALPLKRPVAEGFTNHSSIPVKIGEKATMTVTLSGSAVGVNSRVLTPKILPATFAWYHYKPEPIQLSEENIVSTESSSTLTLNSVTANENGTYECRAGNLLGTTSFFFILDVAEEPVPVSEVKIQSNPSSSVILWAGIDSVSLSCSADGSALHFSWNLNGVPLPSDSRYQYNQDNSIIIISPLDKKDNGPFTCTATNVLNSETSSDLNLNLAWHPDGDIQCSANGTGQTVNLFCSWPGGLPPANINLTFQSHNQTGQDQVMHSVTLSTITSNDELFCHGAQGGQEKNCTLPLQKPDAEGFTNHSSIPVKIGEKATMTVTLSGSAVGVNSRVLSPKILPATFAWYHYKPEASEVSGGNIVSTELSSTLTLNSVTANENGTYECRATNLFGTTSFFFILDVTEEPVSKGLGAGEIAGIVLGVLAGLAIIGIIIFFILKSKKKKAKAQNFGINSAENPIGIPEYAVINKKNGGMAETSLTNNPQDDKDDVKYAVIKFQNQEQTKPPNSEPEVEYSTVKNASRK
uniref:Ig-like domain-containing protein n=1 Tax=Leptobrachium leishanense TaxID=445787 RepID=A0A8C5QDI1_9ANUR